MLLTPRRMLVSLVCVLVSPFCVCGGPVELRGVVVVCCPRVRIGSSPSHCLCPFMSSSLLFRLCVAVFVVGGEVRWCAVEELCPVLPLSLIVCVRRRSIVGLVLCLLWQGCVIVEWRWWFVLGQKGVWCLLSAFHVLWCGLWNGGGGGWVVLSFVFFLSLSLSLSLSSSSSFFFFLFVLVFGVVRAQPCEHARYPRTPLCFFVVSSFFVFCLSSCPAFLVIVEWRRLLTTCWCVVLA